MKMRDELCIPIYPNKSFEIAIGKSKACVTSMSKHAADIKELSL